ncbi:polysaccharide biosynthesis protein [Mucilaginibacter aquaedulcis]|uniref:polysaccharide biosynthesis protein n=1 Tax=Mucilaginibacter aquaedulcis TaxID=1187081 RepID=UPI0025B43552|nr:polysaccharide biosynthesis protein [Mucilaginibacter aquaedulcis]MDN3548786.1 polysaccharide biosynthesis protein [Mucilaginibacter aquaedulcis]
MKTILLTGGTGFLGRSLALKLKDGYRIILTGRNNLLNNAAKLMTGCEVVPMDITHIDAIREVFELYKPDIVIHAAATKYVDLSELFPNECIDINIRGSQNVVRAAIDKQIKLVIGISTDKASPPSTGMYAKSKSIMEKLFLLMDGKGATNFFCLRFGNIAWSTGSVFPIWRQMLDEKGVIESTGSHMRRFMFTIDEACQMVIDAIDNAGILHGRILAKKMKYAYMLDVLEVFAALNHDAVFTKTGARTGEKVDEIMIGAPEVDYTSEETINDNHYYLINYNQKSTSCIKDQVDTNTAERLTRDEIEKIILHEAKGIL